MEKLLLSIIALIAIFKIGNAQTPVDSVCLFRMPDNQKAYVRIPNTGAFFVKKAGLSSDHSGWQLPHDFVESDSNMLYFEMNSSDVRNGPWSEYTSGSFELVINLPNGITTLNLDTLNRLRYHLINNYAERGSLKNANNHFSGLLSFDYLTDSTVIINGTIYLETKKPYKTNQQVVYSNAKFTVFTKAQFLYAEDSKKEQKQQQEKAAEAIDNAIANDKDKVYDSIFTETMVKANNLTGVFNRKQNFKYSLSQSYICTNASLQRQAEGSLMDMLSSNFLGVDAGNKVVYLMHSFYDPNRNITDDEINFSLGIELDSIIPGKTYSYKKEAGLATAILGYWHWGPFGSPVLSKATEGAVTISADSSGLVSGEMDLTFYYKKTTVRVYGHYQLPKISSEDIKCLRHRLEQKYRNKE